MPFLHINYTNYSDCTDYTNYSDYIFKGVTFQACLCENQCVQTSPCSCFFYTTGHKCVYNKVRKLVFTRDMSCTNV